MQGTNRLRKFYPLVTSHAAPGLELQYVPFLQVWLIWASPPDSDVNLLFFCLRGDGVNFLSLFLSKNMCTYTQLYTQTHAIYIEHIYK